MLPKNQRSEEISSETAVAVMGKEPAVARHPSKMHLEQYESWQDMERLRPAWESLLLESPERTIFLAWEWLKPWWNAYGAGQRVIALAAYEGAKVLVGLALLSCEERRTPLGTLQFLRLLGDGTKDSDSLDFIVRPGYEQPFSSAVLDWCEQHKAEWDVLALNTVPAESPVARALGTELEARRWVYWQRENAHQVVHLPNNWEEYLASLSRKLRKEINQKLRRMEKNHQACQRRCMTQEELPDFLEKLFDLHTKRWSVRHEAGSFGLAARRQFYAEMGAQFLERGWLEFWLLEFDGKPVATEFNFQFGKAYYTLQNGFDPAFSSDSVGTVLKALILRDLISRGVESYDFLGDSDPYKLRWKATTHLYLQRSCARPGSRGAWYLKLTRSAAAARARLRSFLPESARKSLRSGYQRVLGRRAAPATAESDQGSEE
jgi:CelD/BcsL family acetyltransferase involved in cellulose biosynthesis